MDLVYSGKKFKRPAGSPLSYAVKLSGVISEQTISGFILCITDDRNGML